MIHSVDQFPPGAIPIAQGEIPVTLHPEAYVAAAQALGYRVVRCWRWFYLVRVQ